MIWMLLLISLVLVLLIIHSYLIYPALLEMRGHEGPLHTGAYVKEDELPRVFILFAAYNEDKVIREKLESTLASDYPKEKLQIWVGSDGSDDDTDSIVEEFMAKHDHLRLFRYNERAGKAVVINKLMEDLHREYEIAREDALLFTDANIMFEPETIFQLIRHFKDDRIGQVGANVLNRGMDAKGISRQEQFYISRENRIKYLEGRIWGSMIGAFGACYALRGDLYPVIPRNFLMEDFYISMHVLRQKQWAVLEPEAVCWEDLPNEVEEEFKRKVRISAGNFQNLSVYWPLLFPPWKGRGFAFLSHKVLRWLTPFMLLVLLLCSVGVALAWPWYWSIVLFQVLLMGSPFLDRLARQRDLHGRLLRYVGYFYAMNAALLMGFVKYLRGVKTNVWKPTKR